MATADPSIYNALMQPRKTAFDYANEFEQQGLMREQMGMARQQNALALEQARRQQAQAEAANALQMKLRTDIGSLGPAPTDEQLGSVYLRHGAVDKYMDVRKSGADLAYKRAQTAKEAAEAGAKTWEQRQKERNQMILDLANFASPEEAAANIQERVQQGVLPPEVGRGIIASMQSAGGNFDAWRLQVIRRAMSAPDQVQAQQRDQEIGLKRDQFGEYVRHNRSTESLTAQGHQLTARGQNMTDARVREANEIARGAAVADAGGPGQSALVKQFGKPPKDFRWKPDGSAEPIPGGPADLKARRSVLMAQAESVIGTIDEALNLTGWKTAGIGGAAAALPMTDARKLAGNIETIKANLGFDRLQQMRDMSPTGGALGQVAVQELNSLQSTVAKLDQLQRPSDVRDALKKTRRHYEAWMKTLDGGRTGASATFDAPGPRQPTRGGSSPVKKPSVSNW